MTMRESTSGFTSAISTRWRIIILPGVARIGDGAGVAEAGVRRGMKIVRLNISQARRLKAALSHLQARRRMSRSWE